MRIILASASPRRRELLALITKELIIVRYGSDNSHVLF